MGDSRLGCTPAQSCSMESYFDFFVAQILLVGDSGVGKSSLLLRFATGGFEELSPTIGTEPLVCSSSCHLPKGGEGLIFWGLCCTAGVDFKAKVVKVGNKNIKLTIWDTAGQERFRTLTSCELNSLYLIISVYLSIYRNQHKTFYCNLYPTSIFALYLAAYYRGAQGIIFVYDVSRQETFESLGDIWMREVDMYGTVEECVKMVVANKTDLVRKQHKGALGIISCQPRWI